MKSFNQEARDLDTFSGRLNALVDLTGKYVSMADGRVAQLAQKFDVSRTISHFWLNTNKIPKRIQLAALVEGLLTDIKEPAVSIETVKAWLEYGSAVPNPFMKVPNDKILETLISQRVEMAMNHRFRCELTSPSSGRAMGESERRKALTVLFGEIAKGMGTERFLETPVERLDQFAVMSVVNNHDTAGLLRSLVNSFMIAYSTPETSERAFHSLLKIEALRAELAESRGQRSTKQNLLDAAQKLDEVIRGLLQDHPDPINEFKILIGPDRLFVKLNFPLSTLPCEIDGVPVESLQHEMKETVQ
jgi:hypothetical protein